MDGGAPENPYLMEKRRRLAAERTLERTRTELSRAHSALVANADRLSLRYLAEREANVRLTDRQKRILAARKDAAVKADRARRRLWHALEAMRDGFALFDADKRLVAANSVYLELFDCAASIAPGAEAAELFTVAAEEGVFIVEDEDPADWVSAQLARWDGEGIAEQVLQTFDGRTIRFRDRRAPDGDIVSLAVDISQMQAREDSLAAARDSAEEAARAKASFLARMSHEMRTPMNGVLGLAEILADLPIGAEAQGMARTIRDSAEALLTIVGDTLDVSQLDAGRMALREDAFDLPDLLEDCARLIKSAARGQQLEIALQIDGEVPRRVRGDAGRLRQIMMNLLGNAAKFTGDGAVTLVVRNSAEMVEFVVTDTGPGIPDEDRAHVFEAFAQVRHDRPEAEGTGLGLTISRGLAERMGGTLTLAPHVEGQGAQFVLALPLAPVSSAAGVEPGLPPRILLADDNSTNRFLLERMLADAPYELCSATDGAKAVAAFAESPAAVVLMDISMPGMDGFAAAAAIHALDDAAGRARTPIIALTAHTGVEMSERIAAAGFVAHQTKPIRKPDLLSAIEQARTSA